MTIKHVNAMNIQSLPPAAKIVELAGIVVFNFFVSEAKNRFEKKTKKKFGTTTHKKPSYVVLCLNS